MTDTAENAAPLHIRADQYALDPEAVEAQRSAEVAAPLPWGEMPYDGKTPREVVDDYVLIRGDLSAEYARKQLADWIGRYAQEKQAEALEEAADERGELWSGSCGSVCYECAEKVADWLHERARFTRVIPSDAGGRSETGG